MQLCGRDVRADLDHAKEVVAVRSNGLCRRRANAEPALNIVLDLIEEPGDSARRVEPAFDRLTVEFALQRSLEFTVAGSVHDGTHSKIALTASTTTRGAGSWLP